MNIQQQLADMKTVCICMPADHKYFYEARSCIQEINKKDIKITLILSRELELLAEHRGKTEVYPVLASKPFPVPRDKTEHIPRAFDIALDLSPEPSPLTAYITASRGKKLTIGLKSADLDRFYTILVNPAENYRESVMTLLSAGGLFDE
ncbi:MAG: hypothetical protein K0B52_02800 [FCB group bacterium]|nr:hypothetical protein [FCB group bacterium]